MQPQLTMTGNLVADPELRYTPAGAPVASFRIAHTPKRFNQQENRWEDQQAIFLTCNVWNQQGVNAADSLQKGMTVIVQGKLRQRNYTTREGENRTVYEFEVDEVGPSLKFATAQVVRNPRPGEQPPAQQQSSPWAGQQAAQPPQGGFGGGDSEPPF